MRLEAGGTETEPTLTTTLEAFGYPIESASNQTDSQRTKTAMAISNSELQEVDVLDGQSDQDPLIESTSFGAKSIKWPYLGMGLLSGLVILVVSSVLLAKFRF